MATITLRDARKSRGLTQVELEALSGVPQSVISALERGAATEPRLATARKLAAALRINISELQFTSADLPSDGA